MMFIEKILYLNKNNEKYKGYEIRELLNKVSIYIVPMVNPDGVNLCLMQKETLNNEKYNYIWKPFINQLDFWKSNIRGVDLNLNYPSGWNEAKKIKNKLGINSPGIRDYVGQNYLSEPETIAMYKFSKINKFKLSISLHSQGQEIYWTYKNIKIEKAKQIGDLFEKVSGYKLTKPQYNSSFAGYKDWFIEEFKKPGYTIEIGKGEEGISLKLEDVEKTYNEIEEIFFIAMEYI